MIKDHELDLNVFPARIVFRVTLKSVGNCRCDSHCLARLFKNLPAPPKHYGVLDVLPFCKVLPKGKTWGHTRQRPAMKIFTAE